MEKTQDEHRRYMEKFCIKITDMIKEDKEMTTADILGILETVKNSVTNRVNNVSNISQNMPPDEFIKILRRINDRE